MKSIQNDLFASTEKALFSPKDIRFLCSLISTNQKPYNPYGLPQLNNEKHSFSVPWQLPKEENQDVNSY